MDNQNELLLKLLGDEPEEALAPIFMEHLLNRGLAHLPHVIQTGAKNGQTLKAHIQNVLCLAWQISDILDIEDSDRLNLMAACYVHDLNKFPDFQGQSYDRIANAANVQGILDGMLSDDDEVFELDIELIVEIIRAHSGHYHSDGSGLFAEAHRNDTRGRLIAIIRAADVLDLSHDFHEREKKDKALNQINGQVADCQYEYCHHYFSDNRGIYTNLIQNTVIDLHKVQGAIPLLYYPEGVWYLVKKGIQPDISPESVAETLQEKLGSMACEDPSKALRYAKVGFKFGQNPFRLGMKSSVVMDILVNEIVNRKEKVYSDKYSDLQLKSGTKCLEKYRKWMGESEKRRKQLETAEKSHTKVLGQCGLNADFTESDEKFRLLPNPKKERLRKSRLKYIQLRKEAEATAYFDENPLWEDAPDNLFNPEEGAMRCGDLVGSFALLLINQLEVPSEDAWRFAAEAGGLPSDAVGELAFFDVQSDRGFRTAALFYQNGIGFETVQKRYVDFLDSFLGKKKIRHDTNPEILDYIASNLKTRNDHLKPDKTALKYYIESDHQQCCHCGCKGGAECESGKLPKGIKPQLFSNRLIGGHTSKVKRNVCHVCQQAFIMEQLVYDTYENHYYLHLFSDGGEHSSHAEPGSFLDALKKGIMKLQRTDCRSFLMQPNQIVGAYLKNKMPGLVGQPKTKFGLLVPKFSQSIGGQISFGLNPPSGKKTNNNTRFLFSLFHLLIIANHFNLRGILSKSAIPPLKADEFSRFFIDHVPLSFRALIPKNDIGYAGADTLWKHFTSL